MSTDVHTLSGAYALDALSAEEAQEFRLHLADCAACREEVRELRNAAARMAEADVEAPPPSLRGRVLDAVDRTPQLPPRPAPGVVPLQASRRAEAGGPGRLRAWLVSAAAVAAVTVGGVVVFEAMSDDAAPLSPAVAEVFEAGDARTVEVGTSNGGRLRVGVSPELNEMAVDTTGLPELDADHVYQLWAVHDGEMASAAVLTDPAGGAAMAMPGEGTQVAVTVEPAGGSEEPTTEAIAIVDPSQV